jgi:hypothetical protein
MPVCIGLFGLLCLLQFLMFRNILLCDGGNSPTQHKWVLALNISTASVRVVGRGVLLGGREEQENKRE